MKNIIKIVFFIIFMLSLFSELSALDTDLKLDSKEKENTAQKLFSEIKCLVCESQTIQDSQTEFSKTIRFEVRRQLSLGKSPQEIKKFLYDQFGQQIFMSPDPKIDSEILIWALPFIFAFFLAMLFFVYKKNSDTNKN